MQLVMPALPGAPPGVERTGDRDEGLLELREQTLRLGEAVKPAERGAILALLGSAERASMLIARLDAERRSVPRVVRAPVAEDAPGFVAGPAGALPGMAD
jgi:phosphate:Na+ symporter